MFGKCEQKKREFKGTLSNNVGKPKDVFATIESGIETTCGYLWALCAKSNSFSSFVTVSSGKLAITEII